MAIFCKHTLIDDYTAAAALVIEIIMYLTVKASNVHATLHNMTVK